MFIVLATLIPALFLGTLTEWGHVRDRVKGGGDPAIERALLGPTSVAAASLFVFGETVALVAIAAGIETTFLVVAACVPALIFTADIAGNVAAVSVGASSPEDLLPSWLRERLRRKQEE